MRVSSFLVLGLVLIAIGAGCGVYWTRSANGEGKERILTGGMRPPDWLHYYLFTHYFVSLESADVGEPIKQHTRYACTEALFLYFLTMVEPPTVDRTDPRRLEWEDGLLKQTIIPKLPRALLDDPLEMTNLNADAFTTRAKSNIAFKNFPAVHDKAHYVAAVDRFGRWLKK